MREKRRRERERGREIERKRERESDRAGWRRWRGLWKVEKCYVN
jgi:hypothetical protein